MTLAVDLPNPGDLFGSGASSIGKAVLEAIGTAIAKGLASAADKVTSELLHVLDASSGISFNEGWWAGDRGQRVIGSVGVLAGVLLLGFLLLAVIQGLFAGQPQLMVRAAVKELPASILGMVVLTAVTEALLKATDGASTLVLAGAPGDLGNFLAGFGVAGSAATQGALGLLMVVVFLVGALLVWIELIVRSSLLYLLVAFAPLTLAARVWPGGRGAFRKVCEFGVALILSKFAIALSLGLGAAALAGGGPQGADLGTQLGTDLSGLLGGATLMLLAAFSPFLILKLLPIVEGATVAAGISRSPARAAQTASTAAFHAQSLSRGFGGGGGLASQGGGTNQGLPSASPGSPTAPSSSFESLGPPPSRQAGSWPRTPGPPGAEGSLDEEPDTKPHRSTTTPGFNGRTAQAGGNHDD